MKLARRQVLLALTTLPLFNTAAQGQSAPAPEQPLARTDAVFLQEAALGGLAETQSSELALAQATDAQVKRFAQSLLDERARISTDLQALAAEKGVELPTELSLLQRGRIQLLATTQGDEFSRRYLDHTGIDAREGAIALYTKAAEAAEDLEVRTFAAQTLPRLERHLTEARELRASRSAQTG